MRNARGTRVSRAVCRKRACCWRCRRCWRWDCLRHSAELYALPAGFYGQTSMFLLLALLALARIPSLEQLRYLAPGEWGNLLGLDRIPEVRTLREKVKLLCGELGRAARWNAALAKEWICAHEQEQQGLAFYVDGHVRVYHGELTKLPRRYAERTRNARFAYRVARQRFYLRATVDYWINALDAERAYRGQPFFYINQAVDHGMVQMLREQLVPWLKTNVPISEAQQGRLSKTRFGEADPRAPRFTLVFDREGYSPELFLELQGERIAALTYHRYPEEDWPRGGIPGAGCGTHAERAYRVPCAVGERREGADEAGRARDAPGETAGPVGAGNTEVDRRGPRYAKRAFRVRSASGIHGEHEFHGGCGGASGGSAGALVAGKFLQVHVCVRSARLRAFRMREHYGLDALVQYGTEEIPATVTVLNPAWRDLDREVRSKHAEGKRYQQLQQSLSLPEPLSEPGVLHYEQQQGQLQERIEQLQPVLEQLKKQRKQTPRQIPVKDLPEEDRFTQLRTERKYFLDTIKMIAYRAETSMAATVREKLARSDDARALLRQIYNTEVDLIPDLEAKTLTVCLHHLTQAAHDAAVRYLCEELTATETTFPGTDLRLVYKVGSA